MSRRSKRIFGLDQALVARGLSVVVLLAQGAVLDYFLIDYGSSSSYAWIVVDVLTALVWISLLINPDLLSNFVKGVRACCRRKEHTDSADSEHRHAVLSSMWFAWFFYTAVSLAPRVCYIYYTIAPDLTESNDAGPNLLKVSVCLTPVLFLSLTTAHETTSVRYIIRLYLERVTVGVVIDLLDTGEFLDVFFTEDHRVGKKQLEGEEFKLSSSLAVAVLVFSVLNMIIPTLGLIEMEQERSRIEKHTIGQARWSNAKVFYLWARSFLVNAPFFIIRVVLWVEHDRQVSVLIVKNVILVAVDALDLWEHYYGEGPSTLSSSTSTEGSELRSLGRTKSESVRNDYTEEAILAQARRVREESV